MDKLSRLDVRRRTDIKRDDHQEKVIRVGRGSWRYSQRVVVTERESHSHRCRQSEIVEDGEGRDSESAVDPEDAE